MTSEGSSTIKIVSKFLDSDHVKMEDLKNIKDVLKLPIYSCKYLNKKEAKILEDLLEIVDIEDASQLNKDDPFGNMIELMKTGDSIKESLMKEKMRKKITELREKYPELETKLKKTITISSLIKDIQDEDKKLDKKTQKVIVVGLDNAGKTAILKKFGGKLGIGEIASLKPTKGVQREIIEGENLDLLIWDFGGQEQYRDKYLTNPDKYFLEVDLLLYVIDVQETDKFEESLDYFNKILNILITL